MPGFPPTDNLYLENPSVRLAGWLAHTLQEFEGGKPDLNLVPGQRPYTRVRHEHHASLAELAAFIQDEHDADLYYYRGQIGRYQVTYSGTIRKLAEAFPELDPLTITFESLVPSIFRTVIKKRPPNWAGFAYPTPLDTVTPAIRAIANSDHEPLKNLLAEFLTELRIMALNSLLIRLGADPRGGIADTVSKTNTSKKLAELVSLSQHYEFNSCMIDITQDPEVAVWFASHRWSGDLVAANDGIGVIYRFKRQDDAHNEAIHKELMTETPAALDIYDTGLLGMVDIAHDDDFGMRPKRQVGGSVMGLENAVVAYILDIYDAIEVFTFPLNSITGAETSLTKEFLCPPDDPLLQVFTAEHANNGAPLTPNELESLAKKVGLSADDAGVLLRAREDSLI